VLDLIHSHNLKAGLAISPETPSSVITEELGNAADLLLVMTVRPGQGGQKFMPECLDKVIDLRNRFPGKNIQVDGGVGPGNACQCAQAGEHFDGSVADLTFRLQRPRRWNGSLRRQGPQGHDCRAEDGCRRRDCQKGKTIDQHEVDPKFDALVFCDWQSWPGFLEKGMIMTSQCMLQRIWITGSQHGEKSRQGDPGDDGGRKRESPVA